MPHHLAELRLLLECAVRGKVASARFEARLAQLAQQDDRPAAAAALRARLVQRASEVELLGQLEAA
jgi:hypothetical protein